jgi:hypothetical protein
VSEKTTPKSKSQFQVPAPFITKYSNDGRFDYGVKVFADKENYDAVFALLDELGYDIADSDFPWHFVKLHNPEDSKRFDAIWGDHFFNNHPSFKGHFDQNEKH